MITEKVTITDCGESQDKYGTTFWCEYKVKGFPYRFEFYTQHIDESVQIAGQKAIVRFLEDCGVSKIDNASDLIGAEFNIVAARSIDVNMDIRKKHDGRHVPLEARLRAAGCVYVISYRDTDDAICKIGRANDPERRLKQLSTSNPYALKLDAVFATPDSTAVESSAHFHFSDRRMNGEWFAVPPHEAVAFVRDRVAKCN